MPGLPVSLREAIKLRTAALSGFNPKELSMRVLACAMLAIAVIAVPARAQTYDPGYPVCMHVYTIDGDYFECRYSTLAQCQGSASGRGGTQCLINPYFAHSGRKPPDQIDRRPRRAY
jgi:hypothetical protein